MLCLLLNFRGRLGSFLKAPFAFVFVEGHTLLL
jgi:hypothetical protein